MIQEWTYEDFLTYLLLLGAHNDLDISEEERDQIVLKVGEEEFRKVKRIFEQHNDAQHIETVSRLYDKYEQQIGGKENLLKALKDMFTLNDRHEHVMDRFLIMMLKRIL